MARLVQGEHVQAITNINSKPLAAKRCFVHAPGFEMYEWMGEFTMTLCLGLSAGATPLVGATQPTAAFLWSLHAVGLHHPSTLPSFHPTYLDLHSQVPY